MSKEEKMHKLKIRYWMFYALLLVNVVMTVYTSMLIQFINPVGVVMMLFCLVNMSIISYQEEKLDKEDNNETNKRL